MPLRRLQQFNDAFGKTSPGPVRRVMLDGGSVSEVDEAEVFEVVERREKGENRIDDGVAGGEE